MAADALDRQTIKTTTTAGDRRGWRGCHDADSPGSGSLACSIYRDTAIYQVPDQETDYISGDPFPAETHERASTG